LIRPDKAYPMVVNSFAIALNIFSSRFSLMDIFFSGSIEHVYLKTV